MPPDRAIQSTNDKAGSASQESSAFPNALSQLLHKLGIVTIANDSHAVIMPIRSNVQIDLRQVTALPLVDIATLTLVVHKLVQNGAPTTLIWPERDDSKLESLERQLEGLGVYRLLTGAFNQRDVQVNGLKVVGRRGPASLPLVDKLLRYVPLTWIDRTTFDFDGVDLWRVKPTLNPQFRQRICDLFAREGLDDNDLIDAISDVFIYELAWNTVIHSTPECGNGVGLFCGRMRRSSDDCTQREVDICLADIGLGIPRTLKSSFSEALKDGRLNLDRSAHKQSQIIRHAFRAEGTQRPVHPSEVDRTGTSGLVHVASSVKDIGEIHMRSDGGVVEILKRGGETKFSPGIGTYPFPLPGVQAYLALRPRTERTQIAPTLSKEIPTKPRVIHLADIDGQFLVRDYSNAQIAAEKCIGAEGEVILDFGFADPTLRHIEYVVKALAAKGVEGILWLWNLGRELSELAPVLTELSKGHPQLGKNLRLCGRNGLVLRMASEAPDAGEPSSIKSGDDVEGKSALEVQTAVYQRLNFSAYCRVAYLVNTHWLEMALIRTDGSGSRPSSIGYGGVYSGRIELPSGRTASRFFSLPENIAGARSSNCIRWLDACKLGVAHAIRQRPSGEIWSVLGFKGTVHKICEKLAGDLESGICRIHLLSSLETPTPEDIALRVPDGSNVILLTDAVSSGSLLHEIGRLAVRCGGKVRQIIVVVDARFGDVQRLPSVSIEGELVPLLTFACLFARREAEQVDPSIQNGLKVDPVALVPHALNYWQMGPNLLQRIMNSISIIVDSEAALCGHVVEGSRHSSVYVRVEELCSTARSALGALVEEQLNSRLGERKWEGFAPKFILFPFGEARAKSVGDEAEGEQGVPRSPAWTVAGLCTDIWTSATPVEVPRAFDSGGRSRISRWLQPLGASELHDCDVVIADDGMWRGTTANSLISVATSLGAKRIVVMAVLARCGIEELAYWESVQVLAGRDGRGVECCYVFPLVLPIPFSSRTESPYYATRTRIRDRLRAESLALIIPADLDSVLRGATANIVAKSSKEYARTWLEIRTYAEIALVSEQALARICEAIARPENESRLAVLELFLQEWALLDRPELRHAVSSRVRALVDQVLAEPSISTRMRKAALSLLRSRWPDEFLPILSSSVDHVATDDDLLERVVLHLATLSRDRLMSPECEVFLTRVASRRQLHRDAQLSASRVRTGTPSLEYLYQLWIRGLCARAVPPKTKREGVRKIQASMTDNQALRHDVRGFLMVLRDLSLPEAPSWVKRFEGIQESWKDRFVPFFTGQILPLIIHVRPVIGACSVTPEGVVQQECEYFTPSDRTTFSLEGDIAEISRCLDDLCAGLRGTLFVSTLRWAAARLLNYVFDERPLLLTILEPLSVIRVSDVLVAIRNEIDLRLGKPGIEVRIEGIDGSEGSQIVFAPPQLVFSCCVHIADNLRKYAFRRHDRDPSSRDVDSGKVLISAGSTLLRDGGRAVIFTVYDDGNFMGPKDPFSTGTEWLNNMLGNIDGEFGHPAQVNESEWSVAQSFRFAIW